MTVPDVDRYTAQQDPLTTVPLTICVVVASMLEKAVADTPAAVPIPAGEVAVIVAYYSASQGYWVPISIKASV